MKTVTHKLLSCLLVAVMLLGLLPMTVFAEETTIASEPINIAGSNMTLGNELEVNFMAKKTDLTATGCTAVITQTKADGSTVVTELTEDKWGTLGPYHVMSARIAAKEMADPLSIEIFDADGNVLNAPYSSSVRDYAGRALAASSTTELVATMMVDMLNYGSSAQVEFGYNTADLANNALTEAQQALATAKVACTNDQIKGTNAAGANLSLEDRIEMNVYFSGMKDKTPSEMYAVISFTDYLGNAKETRVEGSEFLKRNNTTYGVVVDDIVLADARQMVSVTVYDADGTEFGNASDSVSSYVARAEANDADGSGLYSNILKFATSAYTYLTGSAPVEPDDSAVEKFVKKFAEEGFTYRIGNGNSVALSSLFAQKDGAEIGDVTVTVENVAGSASGTYTPGDVWNSGSLRFRGIGNVTVTITDGDRCIPTVLELEVVDAVNATGAANATANDVVVLQNGGFGALEVSGGHTLYGNGFTLTCGSDSVAADFGYSFVTLRDGTLDNVQIVCPNFDYAALYKVNLTDAANRSHTDANGKTRYYNARSGVMVSGNSQILNSRISGGRASVNVSGGDLLIDNSRIELGAVASLLVNAANSLTLRDVTLLQQPTVATSDSTKTLMGFSVLVMCDSEGNATPITLEGDLIQWAWIDETDKQYVPYGAEAVIANVMQETDYLHDLDGDGTKESLNLGFAYLPEEAAFVNMPDITDSRPNKETIPYVCAYVSYISGKHTYVCSYQNTNGTDPSFLDITPYTPDGYGDITTVSYEDTADGLTFGKSFAAGYWTYELNVDLDKLSGYTVDFSKVSLAVNGVAVPDYLVNGEPKPEAPVAVTAGGSSYALSAVVDGKTYTADFKVTGTETNKDAPSLVAANYGAGVCVATAKGSTWHGAAPALEGIQVRYWSVAEQQYKIIDLADCTPTVMGKLNGTNATWTYTHTDNDFTLIVTGGQVHSSNNVSAMPVCVDKDGDGTADTLYFVAADSKGLVNTGNTARTIPVSYIFKDNNNGTPLTFSHTWSVAEDTDNEYKYSDFCNGKWTKLTSSVCVTPDTLVTMADGTKKEIREVKVGEDVLAWNFHTGRYEVRPVSLLQAHGTGTEDVLRLQFSDGTELKVLGEHGIFDADLGTFIFIDKDDAAGYVGHRFVKQAGEGFTTVELVDYEVAAERITAYTILSAEHYNVLLEDLFTVTPAHVGDNFFNPFEIGEDMKYDADAVQADIEAYGLYTYEELAHVLTPEQFEALNFGQFKVSVGKGLVTYEGLIYLIETFINGEF